MDGRTYRPTRQGVESRVRDQKYASVFVEQHPIDNGAPISRMRTLSPILKLLEYFGLPPPHHGTQSPGGHLLPGMRDVKDYVERYISEIEPVNPGDDALMDPALEDHGDAEALAKKGVIAQYALTKCGC